MMKKIAIGLAMGLALAPTASRAQLMLEMNKLTCGDVVAMDPAEQEMVEAWMSGWYNYKLGYTKIDLDAYHQNTANILKYCKEKPQDQLMGVIQAAVNRATKQ